MLRSLQASLAALVLVLGCTDSSDPLECDQSDSTVSCCLKKNPGQYERCGAEAPSSLQPEGEARWVDEALEDPGFKKAVEKGLKYLGEL